MERTLRYYKGELGKYTRNQTRELANRLICYLKKIRGNPIKGSDLEI
jgi:hypothetical protein